MRVGVVKPHWGVAGGFERLLDRLIELATAAGHHVELQPFPALIAPRAAWGQSSSLRQWKKHQEFFRYMALVEEVRRLDLSRFDLVISTQPPTFLVDHPRVMGLFYHQARIFYDLAQLYSQLDEVDRDHHARATSIVQAVDREHLGGVRHWLAGSQECQKRLSDYWDVPPAACSILDAPPLSDPPDTVPAWNRDGSVLCVSRHEWPKRTELAVAAARHLQGRTVELVGGGGRLNLVRQIDHEMARDPDGRVDNTDLWMRSALSARAPKKAPEDSTVRILGAVSDAERDAAYARASVVVAPAYREDYGLTALEAMQWHRPVIVCSDGGGLVDIVEATGAGLIVPPTPKGIAEGVHRVVDDPSLAAELQDRARAVASTYTWDRCAAQLELGMAQAMA